MKRPCPYVGAAGALAAIAAAACTTAIAAQARADSGRPAYTAADVRFVAGMIGHHAQAVLMAGWAPSHDASAAVRALCERIVVGHRGAITMVRQLFDTQGAAQDGLLFQIASDVNADQIAEIDRMTRMLDAPSQTPQRSHQ